MTHHHRRALDTAAGTVGHSPGKLARLSTGAVGEENINDVELSSPNLLYEMKGLKNAVFWDVTSCGSYKN
jgi:hypothetical protein